MDISQLACVPCAAVSRLFYSQISGFVIAIVTPSASWGNEIGSRSHKLPVLRAEVANSSWVTIAMTWLFIWLPFSFRVLFLTLLKTKNNLKKKNLSCHLGTGGAYQNCCWCFSSHEFNFANGWCTSDLQECPFGSHLKVIHVSFLPHVYQLNNISVFLGSFFFRCFNEIASFDDLNSLLVSHYLILIPTQTSVSTRCLMIFLSLQELHTWTFGLCFPVNRWELGFAIKAWTYPSRSWRLAAKSAYWSINKSIYKPKHIHHLMKSLCLCKHIVEQLG